MKRVAIIEDEFYFRQALKKYIAGFDGQYLVCGEAGNGRAGLELVLREKPDIALVDITMPLMDGIEMADQLIQAGATSKLVILTGYSEFEYMQKALRLGVKDYLLKPLRSEDLRACLDRVGRCIDQEIQRGLMPAPQLHGLMEERLAACLLWGAQGAQDARTLMKNAGFPQTGWYQVLLLKGKEPGRVPSAVRGAAAKDSAWVGCPNEERMYCVLMWGRDQAAAAQAAKRLFAAAKEALGGRLKGAAGQPRGRLEEIPQAYREALIAWRTGLYEGEAELKWYGQQERGALQMVFTQQLRGRFISLMRTGNAQAVCRFIDEIFDRLADMKLCGQAVQMNVTEMLSAVVEFMSETAPEGAGPLPAGGVLDALNALHKMDAIKRAIIDYAVDAINGIEDRYAATVKSVNEYIEAHCAEPDLRLSAIADYHYMSVQYLCQIYKKKMNATIGEYIFQVRMDRAKRLLDEGAENITALSARCGYEDPNYFSKCFRKQFGISPLYYAGQRRAAEK